MQESPTPTLQRPEAACPTCGASAARDQLVCLECGGRIALDYRRAPSWKLPIAIVAAVVLVSAAAFALLLSHIGQEAESEVAKTPARGERREAVPPRRTSAPRRRSSSKGGGGRGARTEARPSRAPTAASAGGLSSWPRRNAFTVVLLSAGDPAAARQVARSVGRGGVEAGVLHADDYSSLTPGFWLVFSGQYRTRGQAEKAQARLRGRFSGAYVQYVNGAERRP